MTEQVSVGDTACFEAERARLLGLSYRLLGSISEAEDVVQDAWIKWQAADRRSVAVPEAWLTTVTTRLAVDRLRSARTRRERYPGPWLPEPMVSDPGPPEAAELADSVTLGFLILLDQLGPVERAVFVLADVFDVPYSQIASMVGRSDVACRQMASRARRRIRNQPPRPSQTMASRRLVLDQLLGAIASGDIQSVVECMSPDVICTTDGGPNRRAARHPVLGAGRVARLLVNLAKRNADVMNIRSVTVNGEPGIVVYLSGRVDQVLEAEVTGDKVSAVHIVRNPDKLAHIN